MGNSKSKIVAEGCRFQNLEKSRYVTDELKKLKIKFKNGNRSYIIDQGGGYINYEKV